MRLNDSIDIIFSFASSQLNFITALGRMNCFPPFKPFPTGEKLQASHYFNYISVENDQTSYIR